ncbi:MAG: hypothetical protein EHM89_00070 [Acidobacteria bacterium]|nr:MAG: hypothetical protein EHM89_00070 [Acidobacteriota bacterium]
MSRPTLHPGKWEDVLPGITCSALITDPPYSARTHAAVTTRNDDTDPAGLTPAYAPWTPDDVHAFVRSWSARVSGWMVCLCDDELIPAYRAAYESVGRYAFAPVPCVIRGMSCRMQGDGPSSWVVYAMVGRPRTEAFVGGWTNPGAYVVGAEGNGRAGGSPRGGGRGKPAALEHALVRDYSRPGDLVCDPMAGWGGFMAAALAHGRRAVGAEMDADAYREAVRRLKRPLQIDMFSTREVES